MGRRRSPKGLALALYRERAHTHRHTVPARTFGATRAFRHSRTPRAAAPLRDRDRDRPPDSCAGQAPPPPKDAPRPRRRRQRGPGAPPEGFCSSRHLSAPLGSPRLPPSPRAHTPSGALEVGGRGRRSRAQDAGSLPFPDGGELRPQKAAGPNRRRREPTPTPRAGTAGPEEESPLTSWKVQRKMSAQRPEQQPMGSAPSRDAASASLDP